MNLDQEAIERPASAFYEWDMQQKWADADEETRNWYRDGIRVALDALLSPSPCPTCGGEQQIKSGSRGVYRTCRACNGTGSVPPLLRWVETPPEGWVATAGFPKDRYFLTDGGDEWLLYCEDDHGAFS